jgi:signal transduction histidine kinase
VEAMKQKVVPGKIASTTLLESVFDTLTEGVIVCDREDKILRINAAALKLFEVASEAPYRGISYQQFLHTYEIDDEEQRAISLEPWLMSLIIDREVTTTEQEEITVLKVPSGRKIYASIRRLPVFDAQKHALATVYVFYDISRRYQQAFRLQSVQRAIMSLKEVIAHLPEPVDFAFPEETFLLSPPVIFVALQLVEVIHHVLNFQYVSLLAFEARAGHMHYVMKSAFISEQEHYCRNIHGFFLPSDFLDETTLAQLSANQEVMLSADRLPPDCRVDSGIKKILLIPLFLEHQLVGALMIGRTSLESEYTPEEIELVKAVAAEAMLVIECLDSVYKQAETRAKLLAQQEMDALVNDFLNLASHELNTPLTTIKGNIQVAQRRLARLKRQMVEQPEHVSEKIEGVLSPLASAASSTRLEERSIKDLIDDARIQTNTLELHVQRCDLLALLREAVANQQRLVPERTIALDLRSEEQAVPVNVDAERIAQVIHYYLIHALRYSRADQPVTIQLTVEDGLARVAVHGEGSGIPLEEQERIWERFYFARRVAVQDELDLSSSLGLYLCSAFIERQDGNVGVQSDPGVGVTFWFTLPVEGSGGG